MNEKIDDDVNESKLNYTEDHQYIKITPEDYEEYDMLKKEKDEQDALIMQLKTNNEAKDLEIKNLKMLIENFKK